MMHYTRFISLYTIQAILLIHAIGVVAQEPWPSPQNYVSDFANVISPAEENRINSLAKMLQDKTTVQLAVVTIDNLQQRGYGTVDEAAVKLFEAWGIGQKGKDNGLLILVSVQDRKWRIEVGYGLEGTIPDAIAASYGRNILVPRFRQGEYGQGILDLSVALIARIAEEHNIPLSEFNLNAQTIPRGGGNQGQGGGGIFQSFFSIIVFLIMMVLFIRNPSLFLWLMLLNSGRSRGGWQGGSHFGGGFGGGFGGFGGGRSGGGGASGGW